MATKHEYYEPSPDAVASIYSGSQSAQTFLTTSAHNVTQIVLRMSRKSTSVVGTVTVSIKNTTAGVPSGADLAYGTLDASTFGVYPSVDEQTFNLNTILSLSDATTYAICVKYLTGTAPDMLVYADVLGSSSYADGSRYIGTGSPVTWALQGTGNTNELWFQVWANVLNTVTLSTTPNVSCRGRVPTYKSGCNVLLDLTPDVACAGIATGRKAPVVLTSTPNVACAGVDD